MFFAATAGASASAKVLAPTLAHDTFTAGLRAGTRIAQSLIVQSSSPPEPNLSWTDLPDR
jgi:hypothetical protein